jgi:hypothetical protein
MTVTQQNGNKALKNLGGLKPLNTGRSNVGGKRVRRSSEQATAAKIQRELELARKAKVRMENLAKRQQIAADRAAKAEHRAIEIREQADQKERARQVVAVNVAAEQERIEADAKISLENQPNELTSEKRTQYSDKVAAPSNDNITAVMKKIGADFNQFYKTLDETYGVKFSGTTPKMVKRGFISMKLRGELSPRRLAIETVTPTGIAREAVRFMAFYKQAGLTPQWLNKEIHIKDDPATYTVSGLRGKSHSIVLRKVGTNEAFTMSPIDFKKSLAS